MADVTNHPARDGPHDLGATYVDHAIAERAGVEIDLRVNTERLLDRSQDPT